jgi:hypothetical protein
MRATTVEIDGDRFFINAAPTYAGREWQGQRIEGLLMNSRMVNGIFDDENPATRQNWAYPDTGVWDPDRNTHEFVSMMPEWRHHGLLTFTLNLQGGSPEGYSRLHPWHNSGFTAAGDLKPEYLQRLSQILDRADELGMVVILGLFYAGQDERLQDEDAVRRGVESAVGWVLDHGYQNVLLEINNECDVPGFQHEVLQPHRVHELIMAAKHVQQGGRRLLVSTSYRGGSIPGDNVAAVADFLLMHGNRVTEPATIARMCDQARALPSYRKMPLLFNEDDHFDFDKPANNMLAALSRYASWGYFDAGPGSGGAGARGDYREGYQNVPINWGINTPRKEAFFRLLKEVTGA